MWLACLHVCHDSFICVSWLIHMCDMTHPYLWHDIFNQHTVHNVHICDMTRHVTCEWVMSHMNESCHIWTSHVTYMLYITCEASILHMHTQKWCPKKNGANVTNSIIAEMPRTLLSWKWLIHIGHVTDVVWHDAHTEMSRTLLSQRCHELYYHSNDSFILATSQTSCDMTHTHVWHDSHVCVTWRIHTCDMTHTYVWHDAFIWSTFNMNLSYVPWLIYLWQ